MLSSFPSAAEPARNTTFRVGKLELAARCRLSVASPQVTRYWYPHERIKDQPPNARCRHLRTLPRGARSRNLSWGDSSSPRAWRVAFITSHRAQTFRAISRTHGGMGA